MLRCDGLWILLLSVLALEAKGFLLEEPIGKEPHGHERQVPLAREEQITCNGLLDNLLVPVRSEIQYAGRDALVLPNVSLVQYGAKVDCTNGKVRRLSSLIRKQDSYLSWGGGNVTIRAYLGFDDLHVSYDVKASMFLFSKKATVEVKIGSNSVHVKVGVNFYEDRCWIVLENITVVSLGNIDVAVTGFGILNSAVDVVARKLVDLNDLKSRLNEELYDKAKFKSTCLALVPGLNKMRMLNN